MRCQEMLRNSQSPVTWVSVLGATLLFCDITPAHENHAPLPTKGVTIAGDTIMLSDKAREAIGLTTAKIALGDIHRKVTVNARVELPWHSQAMITSLLPGKISQVLVRPGEAVTPGQELARMESSELESLQLTLLNDLVEREVALNAATNRHDFEIALQRAEKVAAIRAANAAKEAA